MGALFRKTKSSEPTSTALEELGYPQPDTLMHTGNSTAGGAVSNKVHQKGTKEIDIHFYWVQDRIHQGHYNVFWKPDTTNLADYFTQHHLPHHHQQMRPVCIHCPVYAANASVRVCYSSHNPRWKHNSNNGGKPQAIMKNLDTRTHRQMERWTSDFK